MASAILFAIYEHMMKNYKIKYGDNFYEHEMYANIVSSVVSGCIGYGLTNAGDVITVTK